MKISKNNNIVNKIKLKDLCYVNLGQSPSSESYTKEENDLPFFQGAADFSEKYTKVRIRTDKPIKMAKKDDLLMTVRAPVGRVNFASDDCSIGRGLCSFIFNDEKIKKYLYFYLKNLYKNSSWDVDAQGAIFEAVNKTAIENKEIAIDFNTYERISNFLEIFEDRIYSIKSLLEKIEIRNQYYIEKILTGEYKVNNGKIIKTTQKDDVFKKEYLKNLFELRMGETILRDRVLCYCPDENFIPVYSATEESKIFGYVKRDDVKKILTANDLILSARGSIGFLKITDEIKTSTQTTIQMVSKSDFSTYLVFKYLQLNRKKFFVAEGAAIPQITIESIKNIEIPIFDNNEIELFLKKLDLEKEKIEKLLSLEEKRFEWLSDKLLSGEYIIED